MTETYNPDLCSERHRYIGIAFDKIDDNFVGVNGRLKKVENRFLAIMTTLVLNLLGVIGTLIVIILRGTGA